MTNQNKPNGTAPVTPQVKPGKEIGDQGILERIEGQLATAVRLQWAVVKTLQRLDATLNIFAGQKKRELDEDQDGAETGQ